MFSKSVMLRAYTDLFNNVVLASSILVILTNSLFHCASGTVCNLVKMKLIIL